MAGEGSRMLSNFFEHSIVAIGWDGLGNHAQYKTLEDLRKKMKEVYPNDRDGRLAAHAHIVWKFSHEMKTGDRVLVYNPETRLYQVGAISSDATFDDKRKEFKNLRKVQYSQELSRDSLSAPTRNTLGAIMSLFEIKDDPKEEIEKALAGASVEPSPSEAAEEIEVLGEDVLSQSHEFIKDRFLRLDWEEMQELTADLLRAMGYKTRVSPRGPDRGRDIVASPDGLGLEDPRILVEVKHRERSQMGAPEVQRFIGALKNAKGVYVSTRGFTKEARYVADSSNAPLTLVDSDELARLIVQYYDSFDSDSRALIPLRKIYWPLD